MPTTTMLASALALLVAAPVVAIAADPPSGPAAGSAAAPADDAEARRKLEEQIAKELGQGSPQPPPAAGPPTAQGQGAAPGAAAPAGTGGNPMARLLLLPDISAIGDFQGVYDSYDVPGRSPRGGWFAPRDKPTPQFQELELALQSVIDPYARADVFIGFSPDGVDVEEAYLTTLNLPAGLQLRAGKFFSPVGRQNQQHPHIWDFVDAPLALTRLLASDVLSGAGLDVAWLAPLPWFAELHLAGQATKPFDVPGAEARLTGVARLLQYFSLGDATTLGVGLSAARRDEASGGGFSDVGGVDVYLRIRPPTTRAYLAVQGELLDRRYRGVYGGRSDAGGYAQVFWRHDAYFGWGVRYDQAPVGPFFGPFLRADPTAPAGTERRYGAVGSWFPSEFQRLRLQVSYDRRPTGQDGLEVLLALEFGIGAHGAHPF